VYNLNIIFEKSGDNMGNNQRDMNFDKSAARYDDAFGSASRKFYRLLLEQVKLEQGAVVLDVGCGTGAILRSMADAYNINGFGIDMSENMIEQAKRKCPEMDIQVSRCEETPFANNSFDVITVCMAYHHFSDKIGFIKEAARIIKPGGCLYIADPRFPFIVRRIMNGFFKLIRVAGAFFTPEEIHRDFAVCGFEANGSVKDGFAQVVKMKMPGAK
jgi:ubiquinone/menaquinone biosynthesis C-methylase UbiE